MSISLRYSRASSLLAVTLAGLGAVLLSLNTEAPASSGGAPNCDALGVDVRLELQSRYRPATATHRRRPGQASQAWSDGLLSRRRLPVTNLSLRTPRTTISSAPGDSSILIGRIRVEQSAKGATIENLVLNGRNPQNLMGPLIYADHAKLLNNDITNDRMATCVHVDSYSSGAAPTAS